MSSYCTIADVLNYFPRFVQSLPNNITNTGIQAWIDNGKAEIRARFLRRSLDPDNPASLGWTPPLSVLTTDQTNVLRRFNTAYAVREFADAAYNQLNKGELAIAKRAQDIWNSMIADTDGKGGPGKYLLGNNGAYDALFSPNSTHIDIGPQVGGFAGADFNPCLFNNETMGTFFLFQKGMKF